MLTIAIFVYAFVQIFIVYWPLFWAGSFIWSMMFCRLGWSIYCRKQRNYPFELRMWPVFALMSVCPLGWITCPVICLVQYMSV